MRRQTLGLSKVRYFVLRNYERTGVFRTGAAEGHAVRRGLRSRSIVSEGRENLLLGFHKLVRVPLHFTGAQLHLCAFPCEWVP
jgi:hypothetical protein